MRFPKSWHVCLSLNIGRRLSKAINNCERLGATWRINFNELYSRDECNNQTHFKWDKFGSDKFVNWTKIRQICVMMKLIL